MKLEKNDYVLTKSGRLGQVHRFSSIGPYSMVVRWLLDDHPVTHYTPDGRYTVEGPCPKDIDKVFSPNVDLSKCPIGTECLFRNGKTGILRKNTLAGTNPFIVEAPWSNVSSYQGNGAWSWLPKIPDNETDQDIIGVRKDQVPETVDLSKCQRGDVCVRRDGRQGTYLSGIIHLVQFQDPDGNAYNYDYYTDGRLNKFEETCLDIVSVEKVIRKTVWDCTAKAGTGTYHFLVSSDTVEGADYLARLHMKKLQEYTLTIQEKNQ